MDAAGRTDRQREEMQSRLRARREAERPLYDRLAAGPEFERINDTIELLRRVWLDNPTWRLGQVIANAAQTTDTFYVSDEKMADGLRRIGRDGYR